jgi:tetratricopeptide (TPR) repeat protein
MDRMVYTGWNELDLVDDLMQRRRRAPFMGQPGNAEHWLDLARRKDELLMQVQSIAPPELRRRFDAALVAKPADWRLLNVWSEILMNIDEHEESAKILRREVELLPHRFDVRAGLALSLGYQGHAQEGVQELRGMPGKHGHFVAEFLLHAAKSLARDRYHKEALAFADAAAAEEPNLVDAQLQRASSCAALGRIDEAERIYREVLAADPSHGVARDELVAFLGIHQRWDEAERVLLGGGDTPVIKLKHAQLLAARGDFPGAEQLLRELVAGGGADAELYFTIARVHARQGRTREAKACVDRALELDPTHAAARDLARRLTVGPPPDSP